MTYEEATLPTALVGPVERRVMRPVECLRKMRSKLAGLVNQMMGRKV